MGSLTVTGYTVLMDAGLLCSVILTCLQARRRGLDLTWALDAALATALGGLIGARAAYVAVHWDYYNNYLRRVLRLWDGGLAWHGGLVGGLVAVSAYCASRRARIREQELPWSASLGQVLDVLTPGVGALAICSWLGCLLSGCAYGIETYPVQRLLWALSRELPDLYGIQAPRVAVQLLGAIWSLVVLLVVATVGRGKALAGLVLPFWLGLYSVGSYGLGFLRADETLWVAGWRVGQVADLILAAIGVAALAIGLLRRRQKDRTAPTVRPSHPAHS